MALPKRIHADELISVHGSIGPRIQGIQYNTIQYTIQDTVNRNCNVCTLPRPLLYCIVGSLFELEPAPGPGKINMLGKVTETLEKIAITSLKSKVKGKNLRRKPWRKLFLILTSKA
jgi:hypothetical protein